MAYVHETLHHHQFRLAGQGHDYRANYLPWTLRGRPFICAVMRNLPPGHYVAEWPFGRVTLDVLVLPNRVTRVDWRAIDSHAREWDRMVLPEPRIAPVEPGEVAAAAITAA